jgi:3',5'-cyclic AMP phosphodiesterase CpdA
MKHRHLHFFFVSSLYAALCATACMNDITGALRATRVGSVSEVPLAREAPNGELVDSCGEGTITRAGESVLKRRPYLQQHEQDSVLLLLTASRAVPMTLRVTTPDGENVQDVQTTLEATHYLKDAHQHVAHIDGLEPASVYCYSVLDESGALLREQAGFRTSPRANDVDEPVRFIAFGDSGAGSEDQRTLLEQMQQVPFELAILAGDIAYMSGRLDELEVNYFEIYESLIGSIPFYPITGNHEYDTDDAAPFREVFALPDNASDERWYAFDHGPVHFVALDTELMNDEQAAWLEADLSSTKHPWIVVFAHRPPYSSGSHGSSSRFRELFGPILERHQVSLVITGHDHHYERTTPQRGVTYLVTGGGGKSTRTLGTELPETAFSEPVVHFVHVTVEREELTLRAIDATGQEFDSAVISRARE